MSEPVTVKRAVKVAAKTQTSTVLVTAMILAAYLVGMVAAEYCDQLLIPPTLEEIFQ